VLNRLPVTALSDSGAIVCALSVLGRRLVRSLLASVPSADVTVFEWASVSVLAKLFYQFREFVQASEHLSRRALGEANDQFCKSLVDSVRQLFRVGGCAK
jgi:hypothetical protein